MNISQINSQELFFKVRKRKVNTLSNVAFNFTKFTNWKSEYNNFSFNLKQQLNLDTASENGKERHARIYLELGMFKIIDSAWFTGADIWEIQHEWLFTKTESKWSNSLSLYLTSKFLSSYERVEVYNEDKPDEAPTYKRYWANGFFNPMNFEVAYGKTFSFWKNCRINFALAQIKIGSEPILDTTGYKKVPGVYKYRNTLISSEYGFGVQANIRKKLNNHFRWESNTRFFGNAIDPAKVTFDLRNTLIINPIKHLTINLITRLNYKPKKPPFLVQQRYEVMIGIEF